MVDCHPWAQPRPRWAFWVRSCFGRASAFPCRSSTIGGLPGLARQRPAGGKPSFCCVAPAELSGSAIKSPAFQPSIILTNTVWPGGPVRGRLFATRKPY